MSQHLISDCFPLSPMQQGMLFHYLKEPRSGVDIEQLVIHFREEIDANRLRVAWEWLVLRHEILRARFVWEGIDQAQQEILGTVNLPFAVQDQGHVSREDQDKLLREFLDEDRIRGFDLSVAPLLRLVLFRWGPASFSLVWTFHHALLDGRCFPILLSEVFEAYRELATGEILRRPEPRPYRSYIDWLQQQDFTAAQAFWKGRLAGFAAATPLVVDHRLPDEGVRFQQGEEWETLDLATTDRLRELARSENLTMNTLVMGAWSVLLHRYSGEADVIFGATRACRNSFASEAAETIGLFINTVPVRVKLDEATPVLSLLKSLRQQWLDLRAVEHTPLASVKAASQILAGQPLFQTLLVFEKYRLDSAMRSLGGEWEKRQIDLHELTNFPVTLAAYDGPQLSFKIEFDRRRVRPEAAKGILRHLHCLLAGIARDPAVNVGDLPLVNETEQREIVERFNTPAVPLRATALPLDGTATLHELFEKRVEQAPYAIALTCNGESLTYAQLNRLANRLAHKIISRGIQPDSLVGLYLDRSNDLVIAIVAILKAGCGYLPIDPAYPPERVAFILRDAQARILLTEKKLTSNLPSTDAEVISVQEALAETGEPPNDANPRSSAGADNLAYVIYTSGTTGKPKGTLITHRNVTRLFAATENWYGFDERDVWSLFHSTAFDFSVWEIWGALLYGGRLVVVPFLVSRSPEAFYELVARERITVLNQTPSAFRQLMQVEESETPRELALRYVIFGGEALEMQSLRAWFVRHGDKKPLLVNMYGITETTVHVTYRPLSLGDVESGSVIGVPIPDLQVYIFDSRMRPVPVGVPGEMYVGGAGLARGYLGRPELTAQRFVADRIASKKDTRLYRTGDLARYLPGGEIEYLGRIDDQVKIRGFRIELGEIESVLCQHPAIREACVIARENADGIKQLAAYVVSYRPRPEVSEIREYLKKKLPEYMVPATFTFLDALPLTNNGKIDRKALPAPELERPELAEQYAAPRTPAEKTLADIWSKILRVEKVGIHDNFFELGGDSILSIHVIALAKREGLKVTPTLLFENQTIAELAALVAPRDTSDLKEETVAGDVPLTPIQHWFFEQNLNDPEHYNQAFLVEASVRLDRVFLRQALEALSAHHDALRLRFSREQGSWTQSYSAVEKGNLLDIVELADFSHELQRTTIESAVASAHRSFDLQNGPIWRVVYFDRGDQPGLLLIVVHHVAIDGVSWRPLLEDLETAYLQFARSAPVRLPSKTASFKKWSESLQEFAKSDSMQQERSFWTTSLAEGQLLAQNRAEESCNPTNLEGSARTLVTALSRQDTLDLLQQVPKAYDTQINDALLTALAQAWLRRTGSRVLHANVEGHGREALFQDIDLSRTVGWFTTIFPIQIKLPEVQGNWQPAKAVRAVKEQLRKVPRRGIGYGLLRYLGGAEELSQSAEPRIIFNYLGQFDQLLAESTIFRFSNESSGTWHSPRQQRRYALEVNSLVTDGKLQVRWTYSPEFDSEMSVESLSADFSQALCELISHCRKQSIAERAVADFPQAAPDQPALDKLLAQRPDVEDLYPLSPTQTLFFSANPARLHTGFDQWQCTFTGGLDIAAFQQAWHDTVHRHPILRSSIVGEGLREPMQIVSRTVQPPWLIEDWSAAPQDEIDRRWSELLIRDRAQPFDLSQAPVMRFALIKLPRNRWNFLWSLPALFLDGWSWPLVFSDASRIYESLRQNSRVQLQPAPPYRNYLQWLQTQSSENSKEFWTAMLADFREPTPLPVNRSKVTGDGERFARQQVDLAPAVIDECISAARRLQVTPNSLVQGAWALLLSRHSLSRDVVFGSAFSGRPTDLDRAEAIVGPLVSALPVRVAIDEKQRAGRYFQQVHSVLLKLNSHQFTPLPEIHRCTRIPERLRLFDSLIVFQNYAVEDSAKTFGSELQISDFVGPIHNNYPLLLLVEPHAGMRLILIYDTHLLAPSNMDRWGRDLAKLLTNLSNNLDACVRDLLEELSLSAPAAKASASWPEVASQNFVPAQSNSELVIAAVWSELFGIDRISVEENFFDLGGHSLLLVKMHRRLQETLYPDLSIVTIFEHPTVRSLARYLDQAGRNSGTADTDESWNRARQHKQALQQMRARLNKAT